MRLPVSGKGKWLALHAGSGADLLANASLLKQLADISGIPIERWIDGIRDEMGVLLGAMRITQCCE